MSHVRRKEHIATTSCSNSARTVHATRWHRRSCEQIPAFRTPGRRSSSKSPSRSPRSRPLRRRRKRRRLRDGPRSPGRATAAPRSPGRAAAAARRARSRPSRTCSRGPRAPHPRRLPRRLRPPVAAAAATAVAAAAALPAAAARG